MENDQIKKLDMDQLEKVSGGYGSYAMVCSGCGKLIVYNDINEFIRHTLYCKGNPDE